MTVATDTRNSKVYLDKKVQGLQSFGEDKSYVFIPATGLANILQEKHQRGMLTHFMTSLRRVELLVLDEVGFITLHKEAGELLFQVVSDCYEQKSLIITSNLEFSQWNTIFGSDKLTAAMIDRLIHHSHILVFSGPSHRLEESMKRQRKGGGKE